MRQHRPIDRTLCVLARRLHRRYECRPERFPTFTAIAIATSLINYRSLTK
jgi:hypothetical protein